ncbi:MAG: BCCT family transporter, partial [Prevotella sp.]|nr:BCCT family transporter [Prevotella sp.]
MQRDVISILIICLLTIFFITSADSATYALSMMTSNGEMEPPKFKKIIPYQL